MSIILVVLHAFVQHLNTTAAVALQLLAVAFFRLPHTISKEKRGASSDVPRFSLLITYYSKHFATTAAYEGQSAPLPMHSAGPHP